MWLAALLALPVGAVVLVKVYCKLTSGVYKIKEDLTGKVFILTGGSAGIGKEAALELAKHGATLYLPVRNRAKGEEVLAELQAATGNKKIFLLECDFSSLESVRKCAAEFLKKEKRLDVLINNAGLFAAAGTAMKLTADGLELTMAANHFGPFLFTSLLLDCLKSSAPSRIVNTSSRAYSYSPALDLYNPPTYLKTSAYSEIEEYNISKYANILFTRELAHRLHGTGVTVNCLHPGLVKTTLVRSEARQSFKIMINIMKGIGAKTPFEGCQTILYLALAPEMKYISGHYFADCKPVLLRLDALDDDLAAKFWLESEKLTGLRK